MFVHTMKPLLLLLVTELASATPTASPTAGATEDRTSFSLQISGNVASGLSIFGSGLDLEGKLEFIREDSEKTTFEVNGALRAEAKLGAIASIFVEGGLAVQMELPQKLERGGLLAAVESIISPMTNSFEQTSSVAASIDAAENIARGADRSKLTEVLDSFRLFIGFAPRTRPRAGAVTSRFAEEQALKADWIADALRHKKDPKKNHLNIWLKHFFSFEEGEINCDSSALSSQRKLICYAIQPALLQADTKDAFFFDRLYPALESFLEGQAETEYDRCEFCDLLLQKALVFDSNGHTKLKPFLEAFYAVEPSVVGTAKVSKVTLYGSVGLSCEAFYNRLQAKIEGAISWEYSDSWKRTWEAAASVSFSVSSWTLTAKLSKNENEDAVKSFEVNVCVSKPDELPDFDADKVREDACLIQSALTSSNGLTLRTRLSALIALTRFGEHVLGKQVPESPWNIDPLAELQSTAEDAIAEQIWTALAQVLPIGRSESVCLVVEVKDPSRGISIGREEATEYTVDALEAAFKVATTTRRTVEVRWTECEKKRRHRYHRHHHQRHRHRRQHRHRRHHRHH